MIRPCGVAEVLFIETIINEAARAYKAVIPADCWREPYMPRVELLANSLPASIFWDGKIREI